MVMSGLNAEIHGDLDFSKLKFFHTHISKHAVKSKQVGNPPRSGVNCTE